MNSLITTKYLGLLMVGSICSVLSCLTYSPNGSTLQSTLISVIFILLTANMSLDNQLYMIALSVPNTKALGIGGMSAAIFVCTLAVVVHYIKDNKKPSIPLLAIITTVYSFQYLIRNDDFLMGVVMPVKTMANILFFTFLSSNLKIARDSFNVGLRASIALFFGIVSAFVASTFDVMDDARRMAIADNDPNILSIEIAFVLCYFSVAYYSKKQFSRSFYFCATIILGVLSMMCGSRMGMILFTFVLVVSILLNARNVGKSTFLIVLFGVAGIAFLMSPLGQKVVDVILSRMDRLEAADNISNGRFEIWNQYFSVLNSNDLYWLFGLGSYSDFGIKNMAHNFLLEDVAGIGIIGVILLYATYVKIYKKQYRYSMKMSPFKPTLYYSMAFFVPIIGSITLHGLGTIMITTMLYLGVLCMTGSIRTSKTIVK